ncbi:MAG: hypothetical protein RBS53_01200 [Bacteroidales bacterium]|jgi:uncharacterized membrane protein YgcG|nr:hypothetical protein [Bacteroidales bacterium]NLM92752.1 hypothetical protein [Bacteroidales bacterium]
MKKFIFTSIFAFLLAGMSTLRASEWPEEYLGLPGDNLNLYAVMDLFQNSETLEGFERSLNDPEQMINNLDLNGDNYVDYIMVTDYVDGADHTIVMSVALNASENQDVAVFTVEKLRSGGVRIQLIGDEALYGKNYIVEPIYGETPNPGYTGTANAHNVQVVHTTYYEVASWPVVTYIYTPGYSVWRSAWYWGYYPVYWDPWTPFYWHYYYGYHYNWYAHYYAYYRPWSYYRYARYHDFYWRHHRHYSPTIVVWVNNGNYRDTYSRPEAINEGLAEYNRVEAVRHSRGTTIPSGSSRGTTTGNRVSREGTTASPATSAARNTGESVSRPAAPAGNTVKRPAANSNRENTSTPASGSSKPAVRPASPSRPAPAATPSKNNSSSSRVQSSSPSGGSSASGNRPSGSIFSGSRGSSSTGTITSSRPASSQAGSSSRNTSSSTGSRSNASTGRR